MVIQFALFNIRSPFNFQALLIASFSPLCREKASERASEKKGGKENSKNEVHTQASLSTTKKRQSNQYLNNHNLKWPPSSSMEGLLVVIFYVNSGIIFIISSANT
jgi:CRISPR/Cas system CSM-associated protein Csm4 (group 5 of RAMP superfamily)